MPLQGASNTGTNEQDISFLAAMMALYSSSVIDGKTHAQGRLARVAHLMRGPWLRGGSG